MWYQGSHGKKTCQKMEGKERGLVGRATDTGSTEHLSKLSTENYLLNLAIEALALMC